MNKQMLKWVIFGGLFLVPFVPFLVSSSFFFPYITTKAFTWRIIVEVIFAAWVVLALIDSRYRPKKSPIIFALSVFLVIMALANVFGASPVRSFWSNAERMEGYISLLHLGAYFLVASSVFREIDWKKWWNTSLAASFLMVLLASREVFIAGEWRVDATFGNATYLAVYMLIHIFVAALFMWRERTNKTLMWVYGALILSQIFILYNTATRGAMLGLLGGVLVMALLNLGNREDKRIRKAAYAIVAGVFLLVGGFWFLRESSFVQNNPVLVRFATISTEELKSGGRSFVWPMALEGIKDRPFLGWGQDNFVQVFSKYYDPNMYQLEPWFDRAHNIFLDWGVAGGLLGLLSYLSLYAVLVLVVVKDQKFSKVEKSVLIGLVAAYFIHNFFVFDHLVSYILFFSLLAYVHSRQDSEVVWKKEVSSDTVNYGVLPAAVILLSLSIYFFNIKPINASTALISAFKNLQIGQVSQTASDLERAYKGAELGRQEVAEQIASNGVRILSSDMTTEEKNRFFAFASEALTREADKNPREARLQLAAGSFLVNTGFPDEGGVYLSRALEIAPRKQSVYFEIANMHIAKKEYDKALEVIAQAYEMAPEYREAKIIYLVGAIYAGDRSLEARLLGELDREVVIVEDRIISAYYETGRTAQVIEILNGRKELDPANAERYQQFIESLR